MSLRLDAPLSGLEERELQEHLATCADCRREWPRVRAVSATLERPTLWPLRPTLAPASWCASARPPPDLVLRRGGVLLVERADRGRPSPWCRRSLSSTWASTIRPSFTLWSNTGLWLLEIGRTLAGATQAVLRALVMGLSWPAVAGYSMLAVGMILCWLYLVARPTSQTSPA